jgi:aspartate carbamoyltransferase catalytic subunit
MSHILSAAQFNKQGVEQVLKTAEEMEVALAKGSVPQSLAGKIVACLFFEPSTRTRLSFETAVLRLGGQVIDMENGSVSSSAFKGESLEDTTRMVQSYADCIVARHPEDGSVQRMAGVAMIPVINAGDGGNEHPSQALLDLYTIRKEMGRLDNLRVAFGFDPKHSRTIKSLARLLSLYPNNQFTFIFPEGLEPDIKFLEDLQKAGAQVALSHIVADGCAADVFYVNRLQQERFAVKTQFEALRKAMTIKPADVEGKKVVLLDPLPRIDEIDPAVDALPNAKYFQQAKNGLYVRMALLQQLLA